MAKLPYHEIELIKASIKGDTTSFGAIVEKYQSFVCAITYSATGDVGKSEELAQETFISAWQSLYQLKNLHKFQRWLRSIVKNVIRNWLRKQRNDITAKAAAFDEIQDEGTKEFEPVQMAIKKEQESIVREALNQIPPKYREPLVLYYRHKESVREVAQQLQLSEEAVKTRLSRGREYLKEQVTSMIEATISETGPGKMFTTMVIGSIAALSLKSGTATAAKIASIAASETGKIATVTSFIASTTGKIITGTAALIIVGIILLLNSLPKNPAKEPNLPVVINPSANDNAMPGEDSNGTIVAINQQPDVQEIEVPDANQDFNDSDNIMTGAISGETITEGYKFEPKGLVSGLISDIETGEPVVNAELSLYVEPMEEFFKTRTDEHGFYFFDKIEKPGKSKLQIKSFEYVGYFQTLDEAPVIQLKEGENLVRNFKLPRACQIDLFVSDANGAPIKGAESRLTLPGEKGDMDQSYTISETNNDGYLHIGGIAPSNENYLLIVMHRSTVDHRLADGKIQKSPKNDYAPAGQYIKLNDPDKIELVEVVLEKGSEIKGYIEYADGIPGYDLEVSAEPSWWNISLFPNDFEVDEFGFFTLKNIVPREYSIQVFMNKSDNSDQIYKMTKIFLPLPDNELFTINLPVNPMKPTFSMEGSIIYNGPSKSEYAHFRVRDLNGKIVDDYGGTTLYKNPVDNPVKNLNPEEKTHSVKGNPFVIRKLEAGTYSLEVSGSNMYKKIENIQVPGDFVELEIASSPSPIIDILVLDAKTNQPVTNY